MCVCIFNCDFRRKRGGNQEAPATQLAEQNQRRKKGPSQWNWTEEEKLGICDSGCLKRRRFFNEKRFNLSLRVLSYTFLFIIVSVCFIISMLWKQRPLHGGWQYSWRVEITLQPWFLNSIRQSAPKNDRLAFWF